MKTNDAPVLSVQSMHVDVQGPGNGRRPIVRDVSLTIGAGEALGLIGESGSGKSMTTKAIMRLLPDGAATRGAVLFNGTDILKMRRGALSRFRSRDVGIVFQDPRSHINPLWRVGDFLTEGVVLSGLLSKVEAERRATELMSEVGIPDAQRRMNQYPHQLSGGLLQRAMIVAALMPGPKLLLADEATTALDVTVQSDVMAVLQQLRAERSLAMLFITHDLDLAAATTDSIAVMYAGSIVERGPSDEVYSAAAHPYTRGLLASRPSTTRQESLKPIPGRPAGAFEVGLGCGFAARCPFATEICREIAPQLQSAPSGRDEHEVACHHAGALSGAAHEEATRG